MIMRSNRYAVRTIDDEVIVAEVHRFIRLSGLAAKIWHSCTKPLSLEDIRTIATAHNVDEYRVRGLTSRLLDLGVLEGSIGGLMKEKTLAGLTLGEEDRNPLNALTGFSCRYLIKVAIELTTSCNLKCDYCYAVDMNGGLQPKHIEPAIVLAVIDQMARNGALHLTLTGGEPLCHPQFTEIVNVAVEHDLLVHVNTNGTRIKDGSLKDIAGTNRVVFDVTLHGDNAHTHDTFAGVQGAFRQTMSSLRRLKEARIPCRIKVVVTNRNVDQTKGLLALSQQLGVPISMSPLIFPTWDGRKDVFDLQCSPHELHRFMVNTGYCPWMDPCGAGDEKLVITADAQVLPCNFVRTPLGTLVDSTLYDIWRSSAVLEEFRRDRWFACPDSCLECEFIERCPRCAALAYAETGAGANPSKQACTIMSVWKGLR